MRTVVRLLAALAMTATFAAAQVALDAQTELRRAERARSQSEADVARLLDLRMRHDLGIGGGASEADAAYQPKTAFTSEQLSRLQQESTDANAARDLLSVEYKKLRDRVDQVLAEAAERSKRDQQDRTFVEVPVIGSTAPRTSPAANGANGATQQPDAAPSPTAESSPQRPPAAEMVDTQGLDPLRAQIQGSENHLLVAQAMFKAGQAVIERAASLRAKGQLDLAKQLDDRGRDHLLRALDELAPVTKDKQVPFEALFCQGRCREMLFRYSERHEGLSLTTSARDFQRREQEVRDSFLTITARDVKKTGPRGDVDVLGPWGMAAQAAMEHFRWMNLHGSYDVTAKIEALTWPGEHDQ